MFDGEHQRNYEIRGRLWTAKKKSGHRHLEVFLIAAARGTLLRTEDVTRAINANRSTVKQLVSLSKVSYKKEYVSRGLGGIIR